MRTSFQLVRGSGLLAAALLPLLSARAQLVGAKVTNGSASFSQSGNTTTVTAANNTVIQYSSFNIQKGQTVDFVQPTSKSTVLNWVNGSLPTHIFGTLLGNGHVYIVNQEGVFFGPGAFVNVGALYAVAGSISTQDFLSGTNRFTANTGAVVNEGTISAHTVALIGQSVTNRGSIIAPNGFVTLAAGDGVILEEPDSAVFVNAASTAAKPTAGVTNTGIIDAAGGHALLAAGDLYSLAISQSGTVRGAAITLNGGAGTVDNSGTLDASRTLPGGIGGSVRVFGGAVILEGTSILDADGFAGGGEILVGGGKHGQDPTAPDATTTTVEAGATIQADATGAGNGGSVVVWSNTQTTFAGGISAQGDAQAGTGGSAEVSSGGTLNYAGYADLLGAPGRTGTLLLDPQVITIGTTEGAAATGESFSTNANGTVTISNTDINAALNGANVDLQANDDITVNAAIDGSTNLHPGNLSLEAGRSIAINADIKVQGSFSATANDASATDTDRDPGVAALTMAAGTTITTTPSTGADITLTIGAGPTTNNASGAITVTSLTTNDDILINNANANGTGGIVQTSGTLTGATAAFVVAGASQTVGSSGNPISGAFGSVAAQTNGGGVFLQDSLTGLQVGGAGLQPGLGITTGGGNIQISNNGTLSQTQAINSGGGMITLSAGALDAGTVNAGAGSVTLVIGGSDTFNGPLTAGSLNVGTGGNAVALLGTGTQITGPLTLGNSGGVTIGGAGGGTYTFSGGLTSTASTTTVGGTIATTNAALDLGTVALAADTTLKSGTGTLTLGATTASTFNLTLQGDVLALSGGPGTVLGSGALTIEPASASTSIGIKDAAGQFDFTTADFSALGTGFSSLTFTQTSGGATITVVGPITFAPTLVLGGGAGSSLALSGALTSDSNLTVNIPTALSGTSASLNSGGTLTTGAITAGSTNLTLQGANLLLGGAVTGTGTLLIEPNLDAATIGVASGAGTFNLSTADLNQLGTGFSSLTLGRATGTGAVTIGGSVSLTPPFTIQGGIGGSVVLEGNLTDAGALTINLPLSFNGTTAVTLDSGGLLTLVGVTGGATNLTLEGSNLALGGAVSGTGTLLMEPNTDAATIGLATGVGTFNLSATELGELGTTFASETLGRPTGTGAVTIGTAVSFTPPFTIQGGSGGSVVLKGNLTDAGALTIGLPLSFGGTTAVTLDSGGLLSLAAVTGGATNLTFEGSSLALTGAAGSVTGTGTLLIEPSAVADTIGINNGAGTFQLSGADLTALGTFASLTLGQVAGTGVITTAGTVAFASPTTIQGLNNPLGIGSSLALGGSLSASGSLTVNVPTTLTAAATLAAPSLVIGSVSAGSHGLTLQADSLDVTGGAGSVAGTGSLTLATNAATTSIGLLSGTGTLDLSAAVLSDFTLGTFSSLSIGSSTYTGTITGAGTASFGLPFRVFGAAGSAFDFSGSITGTGTATLAIETGQATLTGITLTTNNAAITDTAITTVTGGNAVFDAGTGPLSLGKVSAGANSLTLTGDTLGFTAGTNSISGTGVLTIEPAAPGDTIGINDPSDTLNITPTDIAAIAPGFASIDIGRADGTGEIDIQTSSWADPLIISTLSGPVFLQGTVTTTTATNGYNITIAAPKITLSGDAVVSTAGTTGSSGNIDITSTLDGFQNLTLNAGTGTVTIGGGIGTLTPLANLAITTGGVLTQGNGFLAQAWNVNDLTVASSGTSVFLTNPFNVINGTVRLSGSAATAFTLVAHGNLAFGTVDLTNPGSTLTATSDTGSISQAEGTTMTVNGTSTFTVDAAGANILVGNLGNTFGGVVTLTGNGGNNDGAVEGGALQLGNINLGGAFAASARGGITQATGTTIVAGGPATFTATAPGTTMNLGNLGNQFSGTVSIRGDGATTATIGSSANLEFESVVLTDPGSALMVNGGGNITQDTTSLTGIQVGGAATFNAYNGGVINLTDADNAFAGTLNLSGTGATDAFVTSSGGVELDNVGHLAALDGLTVVAGGSITQTTTGSISVTGGASFTVTAPNSDINLSNGTNDFTGTFTAATSGAGSLGTLGIGDIATNASSLVSGLPASFTSLIINFPNSSIALPGLSVVNLTITNGAGDLTQTGPLNVTGAATFAVGAHSIELITPTNNFNQINITSAESATIVSQDGIQLSATSLAGALNLTAPTITLAGDVTAGGAATFDGMTTIDGNLSALGISLPGTTVLGGAGAQTLDATTGQLTTGADIDKAAGNLTLKGAGGISVQGSVTVTAGTLTVTDPIETTGSLNSVGLTLDGNVTLDANPDSLVVQQLDAGTGTLTATGTITKTTLGSLSLTGSALVLDSVTNESGSITFNGPVSLSGDVAAVGLTLGTLTLTGAGTQTLDAGPGALTLTGNLGKNAGSLVLNGGGGITLDDTLTIPGGSVTANGPSTIEGNISASGINLEGPVTLTSAGLSTLNANSGTLDIAGSVTKAAGDLTLTGGGGVDLAGGANIGGALTVNGLFTVGGDTTADGLTFSGAVLNGASMLSGGAGALVSNGNITATTGGALTIAGAAVTINGSVTTAGPLTFASASTISGNVSAQGLTFLGSATLDGSNQTLGSGGGTFISTGVTLDKPTGNLTLTGAAGQLGTINVGGVFTDDLLTSELEGTYTAGSFAFAHPFQTVGSTALAGPVSLGSSFNTNGHDLTFGGPVTLTAPITVDTGGNKITFNSTLNGDEALTFDIGAGGSVQILGNAGGITPLASLTTSGPGTLYLGGSLTTDGHSQNYGTPVVLAANSVLTELNSTGEITFNSTVDAAKPGGESLTIVSQATVTFGGAVGGTGALSSLSTSGGGLTVIAGGGVTTTGAQTYTDAVQLDKGPATFTTGGGALSFSSLDGNGENLTLATGAGATEFHGAVTNLGSGTGAALSFAAGSTGPVTFDGALGANGALTTPADVAALFKGDVTLAQGGTQLLGPTTLAGITVSAAGDLTFGALTLTTGASTLTASGGGAVAVGGPVNGAESLTVTTTGMTTFAADVGGTTSLTGLSVSGPATVAGNVRTSDGITFGAAVTLSGAATQTLAAGSGAFSAAGAVGKAGAGDLDVTAGTTAAVQGDVTVGSGALTLDAPALTLGGNVAAVGITATHDLTLNGTGAQALAAGTGNLSVLGVTKAAGDLTLRGAGADLGGNVSAPGGRLGLAFTAITLGSDLELSSGGGDLTLAGVVTGAHALTLDAGGNDIDAGTASFGSASSALSAFAVNGATVTVGDVFTTGSQIYTTAAKGVLFLAGTTYQASSGNLDLNSTGTPLTSIPDVATIVKSNAGDLTLDASGNFTMGLYQKLSVLGGDLLVRAGGTATLSDLSVAGTLTVDAAQYSLLIRAPSNVLVSSGEANDLGLDFVAATATFGDPAGNLASGSQVKFNTASGSNNYTARFATADGKANVPAYPGFSFYTLPATYFDGGLITSLLFGPLDNAYLSLRAIGFVRANVDSALPPTAPPPPIQVVSTYVVPAALRDDLVKLGIFARPDSDLVLQPFDPDAPIYDATIKSDDRSPERFEVADSRISSQNVFAAVRLYRQLFEERTPDGRTRSRINEIQSVLAAAYASYHRESGATDPDGFRRYLEHAGGPALNYLNQLRDLVAKIGQVGLTPNEFSISKTYVLRSIRIPGMSLKALREAVAPEDANDSSGRVTASLFPR